MSTASAALPLDRGVQRAMPRHAPASIHRLTDRARDRHGHDRTTTAPGRVAQTSEVGKLLDLIKQRDIQVVDVKFCDLPGTWQHFSIPAGTLDEDMFREGLGFDGSSIRGFQAINESDMLLLPDVSTAFVDPVLEVPTLSLTCDIYDPVTLEPYSRDPRFIAFKAEEYLQDDRHRHHVVLGAGGGVLHLQLGPVRPERPRGVLPHRLRGRRAGTRAGTATPNLGHRPRHKEGYFPVPPVDRLQDVRSKIMLALIEAGMPVEVQHHEVATAGQAEIDFRFGTLVQTADRLMVYKYIVKNVCHNLGLTATFMPKPLFGDNGSGMHVHQSLWKGDKPLFYDESGYALLSETRAPLHRRAHRARAGAAGALRADDEQLPPPGARLRGAGQPDVLRAEPVGHLPDPDATRAARRRGGSSSARRIPTANPYLAFAAMLMAGLDGIKRKLEPPAPIDEDLYELHDERKKSIKTVPGSLAEALDALEADHDFLLEGDVFTPDVHRDLDHA